MDVIEPDAPADLVESLPRSKADLEAGRTVPMEPFLDRLRASIARMEARQPRQPPDTAA